MCGFAGVARDPASGHGDAVALRAMADAIRHRGPDGSGVCAERGVGLAHVRLSIIDLECGAQPMANEDGRVVVVYNGEIYNYLELREQLVARGHRFRTRSDTEVLVHGYEEWGDALPERLNGQFAFAIHDRRRDRVLLARDRFGVRPLFYAERGGALHFASEVKALFAGGGVRPEVDLEGLDEVFTFWGARPPRTVFRGVSQLEPGTCAVWSDGRLRTTRYYALDYPGAPRGAGAAAAEEPAGAVRELDELLRSSVALRMRADVPVGGYLSGGLDSSITCALAAGLSPYALRTFSVTFADPALDESEFQRLVARDLRSQHRVQHIGAGAIAEVFPEVVYHAETPLVRTAPAPMFLLARLTRESGIKVVLTGEGADELFLGYDLFKETKVREFCARRPESMMRPCLFDRLYPYLDGARRGGEFWRKYFLDAGSPNDPLFSHIPRFQSTSRIKDFYAPGVAESLAGFDALSELRSALPERFARWDPLHKAAYLEMTTLLSPYLLSSQSDRMGLAHGVETRFPFLDHRVFELAARLPVGSKLRGLKEKEILKRWARGVVPPGVTARSKQPYRAPDVPAFFGETQPEYVRELLSPDAVARVGLFSPRAVSALVRRCEAGRATGFAENQALVAILSTHLWYRSLVEGRADRGGTTSVHMAPEPAVDISGAA